MSRNLKPLERKGLIQISEEVSGRSRIVEITTEGKDVIAKAKPEWKKAQKNFRAIIGDDDMNTLIDILDRVYTENQAR